MKIYRTGEEVESITINCTNGMIYSIWMPYHVNMKIGTLEYSENDPENIRCEVDINCEALFKNINIIEE